MPNYAARALAEFNAQCPGQDPDLARLYTLLVLTRGEETTLRDVHDAWSMWTIGARRDHPYVVPFDQLPPKIADLDRPDAEAIHRTAAALAADLTRELTMPKLRKKPAEVEAHRWTPGDTEAAGYVIGWIGASGGHCRISDGLGAECILQVITISGEPVPVHPGEWVIAEPKPGRFYPCAADLFATTYEPLGAEHGCRHHGKTHRMKTRQQTFPPANPDALTSPEIECLILISRGHTDIEIAEELEIKLDAVKYRIRNMLVKLAARDRAQAVNNGWEFKILGPHPQMPASSSVDSQ